MNSMPAWNGRWSQGVNSESLLLKPRAIEASPEQDFASDWPAFQSILAYGVPIGIRTNKPELLEQILDYAPPLWKPTSAAVVERLFSFRVAETGRNGRSAHVLMDDVETIAKSRSLKTILETFEVRAKMHVAEMARRRVFVHAGAVGWHGRAIIIPGRSLSGKTRLVAELVRAGATYYSDEYAVLDAHGRVYPYPKPLAIRKEGSGQHKKCPAEEIGGVTGTRPLPVGLIVIVSRYKPGGSWRPARLSEGPAVLELLSNTIPARRKPQVVISTLQRAVSGATCFKGGRGEAEEAARLILERWNLE
jgi:hypothetical protein